MIPILYNPDAKVKIDWLADCLSCEVTEERNGMYELMLEYPVSGRSANEIISGRLIKAKSNQTDKPQFFIIYKVSKPLQGVFTVSAHHISYALTGYPFNELNITGNAQIVINELIRTYERELNVSSGFVAGATDITTSKAVSLSNVSARAALGGAEGSILDVFGGEYHFDNYKISLLKNRGKNNGVRIAYGKNLTGLKVDIDSSSSYTGVYGFVKNDKVNLHSVAKVENKSKVKEKFFVRDFSQDFSGGGDTQEEPTQEKLDALVTAYADSNDINAIKISMAVNFVDLSKTPEYKDFLPLEKVDLCDYVKIYCKMLDVNIVAKVVKTVYNVLTEEYSKIIVGNFKNNIGNIISQTTAAANNANKKAEEAKTQSSQIIIDTQKQIDKITQSITGNSGGHIVTYPAENPSDLFILDTDNLQTAKRVYRLNLEGFGFSENGINGPFKFAFDAQGRGNASFFTIGTLNANIIKAGILQSADKNHLFSFNLESGKVIAKDAELTGELTVKGKNYDLKVINYIEGKRTETSRLGMVKLEGGKETRSFIGFTDRKLYGIDEFQYDVNIRSEETMRLETFKGGIEVDLPTNMPFAVYHGSTSQPSLWVDIGRAEIPKGIKTGFYSLDIYGAITHQRSASVLSGHSWEVNLGAGVVSKTIGGSVALECKRGIPGSNSFVHFDFYTASDGTSASIKPISGSTGLGTLTFTAGSLFYNGKKII